MAIFSPDEQLVLTGVCTGKPQDETGALAIYDRAKGEVGGLLGLALFRPHRFPLDAVFACVSVIRYSPI